MLVDISGGGVKFATTQGGFYHLDQMIEIRILFPEVGDVRARMRGLGKVVRLEPPDRSEIHDPSWSMMVAITLDIPLRLERM
ncbi:MAG: hypothetical protein AB1659_12645 [Thermodesulfobacteriota bacterium]